MPKRDRNNVVLGPARLSLEDEALARARMSSTRSPSAVPPPPSVSYPIPGFWGEVPWAVLNTTEFGGYQTSLLWNTAIFNLADTTQSIPPPDWDSLSVWREPAFSTPSGFIFQERDARVQFAPKFRAGKLYHGAYYRNANNTEWVGDTYTGSYFGSPVSFTAAALQNALRYGWTDSTHTYTTAFAENDATYCYMIKIPHTGPFSVTVLPVSRWDGQGVGVGDYGTPKLRILGVHEFYVWAMREPSPSNAGTTAGELNLFNVSTNVRQRRPFYYSYFDGAPAPNTIGLTPSGTLFYGGNRPFTMDLNLILTDSGVQLPGFPNADDKRISLQDIPNSAVLSMTSTGFWYIKQDSLSFVELQQPGQTGAFQIAGLTWDPAGIGSDMRWSWVSSTSPLVRFLNKRPLAEILQEAGI